MKRVIRLSIDATDNNVSDVRDMISIGAMEDHMVEEGWYSINDAVGRWDEENNNEENGGM